MVKAQPTTSLEGKNIVLRPFGVNDINENYLNWLNDPIVNAFSRRKHVITTREDVVQFLSTLKDDEMIMGIYLKEGDRHIGNVQFGPIDQHSKYAEVRIMMGDRTVWGKGLGTEAIYVVTKHLFNDCRLNRVEANTCNPAFSRLVEKLGWVQEGTLRKRFYNGKHHVDFLWYGILKNEFKKIEKYEP